jgi:membrane-associated protease RseP (regulator of RpoE activity)
MLLMEPNQTPYDLRWRMLGTQVRVHPMFWLVSVIMGANTLHMGIQYLLVWVGCVFVSILVHELGHVWMGQAFGSHGHIVLYSFGGLAIGSNQLESRWQRIAVCFAGPLAGFVFLGIIFGILWITDPDGFPFYLMMVQMDLGLPPGEAFHLALPKISHPLVLETISNLIFINLFWGLMNLLPIWPLDGGQISRDAWQGVSPEAGLTRSLGLSMLVAGLLAIHCFLVLIGKQLLPFPLPIGSVYTAILFAVLALQSYQLLQQAHAQERWCDEHWDDGDGRY